MAIAACVLRSRLYQLVSYIRRGQSATSSVGARGRPASLSLSLPLPFSFAFLWNISLLSPFFSLSSGNDRFYSYRSHPLPTESSAACEKCKSQAKSGEKNPLGFFWPRGSSRLPACPLARSLVRSAPLRSSAREERGWTTAHWDRPLHRNRIRDAFVTYRGRVQVNAIRPIDFYLPPPLCPFRRVSFVVGCRGLVTSLR